ncbi:MAG: 2,3-bisphosphoglycerate-independent phosphoglycerate mutase [Candidatus Doudnabacteria bacterium]|nr:2,3-bisphosphoglycerate-independent phosphoglycerate mutase [Candidatus Doudnabacteria bacterium]
MQNKIYKKVVLVILDGFGVAGPSTGNAVLRARIPTLNSLVNNYPSTTLQASGPLVGLPWGQMGNSESGHLNIGAGRIVGEDLPRITMAIQNGEFFKNSVLRDAVEHCIKNKSKLHLVGMVSDGGVHSLDEHMFALLGLSAEMGLKEVFIHMFTDGRDTAERVALQAIDKIKERIMRIGVGVVASIGGRFYTMDRGGHWNQTFDTYKVLVKGEGPVGTSAEEVVRQNYEKQIFDEMIPPTVLTNFEQKPMAKIEDGDGVVFFNFRQDRALQLAQIFTAPEQVPESFRRPVLQNVYFCTMTEYSQNLTRVHVAFPPSDLKNNLAEVLSQNKFTQYHIAESEKYAHVTSFFNCGKTDPYPGEERQIVTSPNNSKNYVDSPQMAGDEMTDVLTQKIISTNTNFFVANYANCDMVGHTGNLQASIKAVEFIDTYLRRVADAALAAGAALLITADHGNVEEMISVKTGEIDKDHTTNPVPCLFISNEWKFKIPANKRYEDLASEMPGGVISDIAPTILSLLNLPRPEEMTGINLLENM